MRNLILLVTFFSLRAVAATAVADVYDIPEPVAIQVREYYMDQSVHFGAGYIPTDSFNRGYPLSASYRLGVKPYLTWEVISYSHVLNNETQLKQDFLNLGIEAKNLGLGGVLDYPRQIFMTGVHYSPMYSKSLLFNSKLIYNEISFFLGAGTLNFNMVGHQPMAAPGFSLRFYMSPKAAVTAYFREFFYVDENVGLNGIIDFGIGFEYRLHIFGGGK